MEAIRDGLFEILAEQHPATVRGTFYQAVSRGLVDKTERECLDRLLGIEEAEAETLANFAAGMRGER